jgi:steroid delta-isomerase-like uncharacterized protein
LLRLAFIAVVLVVGCGKGKDDPKDQPPTPKANEPPATGSSDGSGSAAIATGGSGSAAPAETKAADKTHATPEAKLKRYQECWAAFNAGNTEVFGGCFAPDAVREQVDSIPELTANGPDGIVQMAKGQRAAFPNLTVTPQVVIVAGNEIAAMLYVSGTNTAEANGMKATKKPIGIYEAEVAVLGDDGKFTHDAFYVDQPTIYHQLGLLPNPSSPNAIGKPAEAPQIHISKNAAVEKANKALIEKVLDAVAKKDLAVVEAAAADDIKLTDHGDKQKVKTKKAYLKWFKDTWATTKDTQIAVKGVWAAEDFVAVIDTFSATPTAAASEGAPGRIETHLLQFFRVVDGKIKQHDIFVNTLKPAVQLGLVDPEALQQQLAEASASTKPTPRKK